MTSTYEDLKATISRIKILFKWQFYSFCNIVQIQSIYFIIFHSKVSVVTHHSSQAVATRLEYDHNGKLVAKNPCARDLGTTISLQNLFSTLPVRHREFLRNIKREFTKLVHVLQGYCLVSTGVRITCSNQVEKGKKTMVVSTNGSDQVKDNITCVFGPKQVCEKNYYNVVLTLHYRNGSEIAVCLDFVQKKKKLVWK